MIQLQDGLMNCKQPTCNILQKAAMDQKEFETWVERIDTEPATSRWQKSPEEGENENRKT